MRKLLPAALAIALAAGFLFLPQQTAAGASQGIGTCLSVLVPSLFPFMAVTIFFGEKRRFGCDWTAPWRAVGAPARPAACGRAGCAHGHGWRLSDRCAGRGSPV